MPTRKKKTKAVSVALSKANRDLCKKIGWNIPYHVGDGVYIGLYEFNQKTCEVLAETIGDRKRNLLTRQRRYARAIDDNRWKITGETIIINKDGRIHDGGNRISAGLIANQPWKSLVVFGIDDEATLATDTGSSRTMGQQAKFMEMDMDNRKAGVVSRIMAGDAMKEEDMDHEEKFMYWEKFREEIDWVCSQFNRTKPKIKVSGVIAACCVASYHVDPVDLAQFIRCMMDDDYFLNNEPERSSIIRKLTSFLLNSESTGRRMPIDIYQKTQRCIHAFCNRERLKALRKQGSSLYRMPSPTAARRLRRERKSNGVDLYAISELVAEDNMAYG